MSYNAFGSMNIAIIGSGALAETLAQNLATAEHDVLVGVKDLNADNTAYGADAYENMSLCRIEEAASHADMIIMACTSSEVRELSYLLEDVRNKVIIDYTHNPEETTEYIHTANAIKAITGSQNVVKCYNCKNYGPVLKSFFRGEHVDMLVAGNSKKAKEVTRILASDMGFDNCYDFGKHNTIQLLDEMTKYWNKYSVGKGQDSKVKNDK